MLLPVALLSIAAIVFLTGVSRLPLRRGGGRATGPFLVWCCLFLGGVAIWTWAAHVLR